MFPLYGRQINSTKDDFVKFDLCQQICRHIPGHSDMRQNLMNIMPEDKSTFTNYFPECHDTNGD